MNRAVCFLPNDGRLAAERNARLLQTLTKKMMPVVVRTSYWNHRFQIKLNFNRLSGVCAKAGCSLGNTPEILWKRWFWNCISSKELFTMSIDQKFDRLANKRPMSLVECFVCVNKLASCNTPAGFTAPFRLAWIQRIQSKVWKKEDRLMRRYHHESSPIIRSPDRLMKDADEFMGTHRNRQPFQPATQPENGCTLLLGNQLFWGSSIRSFKIKLVWLTMIFIFWNPYAGSSIDHRVMTTDSRSKTFYWIVSSGCPDWVSGKP